MHEEEPRIAALALLTGRRDANGVALGARRELTRERIVVAATEHLLVSGFRGMRVDDVAATAKVTRPTLYSYFESKEHLLIAAMAEEASVQLSKVAPLFDPTRSSEDRLRDWVRDTILYVVTAPLTARIARDRDAEVIRILMEHPLARKALGMNPDLDKGRLFSGLIQEAFVGQFSDEEAGEIASLIRALSHMAPSLLDGTALFGLTIERMADLMSRLLVDGMRARGRRQGR